MRWNWEEKIVMPHPRGGLVTRGDKLKSQSGRCQRFHHPGLPNPFNLQTTFLVWFNCTMCTHWVFIFFYLLDLIYLTLFFGQVLLIEVRARARIAGSFVRMSSGGAPLLSRGHRLGSPEGVLSSRSIVRNYTTYQWPRCGANKGIGRECFLISSPLCGKGFCKIRRQIPRTYQKAMINTREVVKVLQA